MKKRKKTITDLELDIISSAVYSCKIEGNQTSVSMYLDEKRIGLNPKQKKSLDEYFENKRLPNKDEQTKPTLDKR